MLMDVLGKEFLSGTGLAFYQNIRVGYGRLVCEVDDSLKLFAVPDYFARKLLVYLLGKQGCLN